MPRLLELPKKQFWIVNATLIASAAFLNARAVMELVGVSLAPEGIAFAAPRLDDEHSAPAVSTRRSADAILRRNPFDAKAGPLERSPNVESDTGETNDIFSAPRCDGLMVLVIAASGDPEWSLAAFRSADGKSVLRRRGGDVNGMRVRFVGGERVWLESDGRLCQASPFDRDDEPRRAAAPASPVTGVKKVGASEYDVDRALIERLVENPADLLKQVRLIAPNEKGGLRVAGIKPNTLFAVLGVQNGDRLETVNGFELADPQKALEAFARLGTADALRLVIERSGKKQTLDYKIK